MLQPVSDEARLDARNCTRASLNNQKANTKFKGKVRMECAATIHFVRSKRWEKVMDACLQHPSVRQHQVVGKNWESVWKTWWENFARMCVFAWRSAWFSGADLGRLRRHSTAMGTAHNEHQWGKLVWTHLCIDHMKKKRRILSKFSRFAMEGSHRRLKRNSGGQSLLRGGDYGCKWLLTTIPLMIVWRHMVGMRPKGHKMGKGPPVYKGTQAVHEDGF